MNVVPKKVFQATVLHTETVAYGIKKITFQLSEDFRYEPWEYVWVEIPELTFPNSLV